MGVDSMAVTARVSMAEGFLNRIAQRLADKEIDSEGLGIVTQADEQATASAGRRKRIGFYPCAANPFHWITCL